MKTQIDDIYNMVCIVCNITCYVTIYPDNKVCDSCAEFILQDIEEQKKYEEN